MAFCCRMRSSSVLRMRFNSTASGSLVPNKPNTSPLPAAALPGPAHSWASGRVVCTSTLSGVALLPALEEDDAAAPDATVASSVGSERRGFLELRYHHLYKFRPPLSGSASHSFGQSVRCANTSPKRLKFMSWPFAVSS